MWVWRLPSPVHVSPPADPDPGGVSDRQDSGHGSRPGQGAAAHVRAENAQQQEENQQRVGGNQRGKLNGESKIQEAASNDRF